MKHFLYSLGWLIAAVVWFVVYEHTGITWFFAAVVGCGALSDIQYIRFTRTL